KARGASRRSQSVNNLKQIALAMHNYHSTFDHFPPAVGYGPDGKTPHSWRVALLPYLEQQSLFEAYHFDEPWDGPHNRELLDKMPPVYRDPTDDGNPTHSSYFVLTGPSALFPGREATGLRDVTDGT